MTDDVITPVMTPAMTPAIPAIPAMTGLAPQPRHLTILVADLTGPDTKFGETFDQWAAEDLMDAVALIDLADAGNDLGRAPSDRNPN